MKSHKELVARWGGLLQRKIERIPVLHEKYIETQGGYGFNSALHSAYRGLAVLDYLLNHNIDGFKENMRKAVYFAMETFGRYDRGEETCPSLVSMTRFEELFDGLSSGDMALAKEYAHHMGGREEADGAYGDEFVLSLGYSLKYAVENNEEAFKIWLPQLRAFCENPKNKISEFMGYPLVLEALLTRDVVKANAAFEVLLAGHKKKCRSYKGPDYGPFFHDSPDADLFVWGIGLVNLCRYHGLAVQILDPLIPEDLIAI